MSIWIFAIFCAILIFTIFLWAWWAYENDKLAPVAILSVSMSMSGLIFGFLASVATLTFGG